MMKTNRRKLVGDAIAIKYNLSRDEMRYLVEHMRAENMFSFSKQLSNEIKKKFGSDITPLEIRHYKSLYREDVRCPGCGATMIDVFFDWYGKVWVKYKGEDQQWKLVE